MTAGDAPALEKQPPSTGPLGCCTCSAVADRLYRCASGRFSCAKELPRTVIRLKEQCANGSPLRQIPTPERPAQPLLSACFSRADRTTISGARRPGRTEMLWAHAHAADPSECPVENGPWAVDIVTADYVGGLSVPSASFSDLYPAKRPRSFQLPSQAGSHSLAFPKASVEIHRRLRGAKRRRRGGALPPP
jgi:hypothetical protein